MAWADMWIGFILLVAAAGLLAAAQFSVRPARRYRTWWVALFATELGHVWAVFATAVAWAGAATAWWAESGAVAGVAGVAFGLALLATGLFARPAWCAARLAPALSRELSAVFGLCNQIGYTTETSTRDIGVHRVWSWRRLWRWPLAVKRGPVESLFIGNLAADFYAAHGSENRNQFGYAMPEAGGTGGLSKVKVKVKEGEAAERGQASRGDGWARETMGAREALGVHEAMGVREAMEAGEVRAALGKGRGVPCVVLVHGGGWDGGDRAELAAFNHWLAARGVAVIAFDYRLAPAFPWPAQREDVRAVVEWVQINAVRLGVDPDRITLAGRSAGAQIATATAYGEKLPGVRAVVALYGVHNLEFVWSIRSPTDSLNSDKLMKQYLGGSPDGERAQAYFTGSAELNAHANVPPTLILHGALDELVWCRHSEKLAAALARVGAPHVFARLPWATHAGEANLHGPSGQLITEAVWRVATGL